MEEVLLIALQVAVPVGLLVVTYAIGSHIERRHYDEIRRREEQLRGIPAVTLRDLPPGWHVERAGLVTGAVVISLDYFKRFLASLRAVVGGPVKSYEPLLDRARREALLRMKEQAVQAGFDAVFNVRITTSRIANNQSRNQIAGVEILAFGTGIQRRG